MYIYIYYIYVYTHNEHHCKLVKTKTKEIINLSWNIANMNWRWEQTQVILTPNPLLLNTIVFTLKKKRKKRETLAHVYRCYENNIWQSIIMLAVVISYFSKYTHTIYIPLFLLWLYGNDIKDLFFKQRI